MSKAVSVLVRCLGVALCLLVFAAGADAQPQQRRESVYRELQGVRKKIEKEQRRLNRVQTKLGGIERGVVRLDREVDRIEKERVEIGNVLAAVTTRLDKLERAVLGAEQKITRQRDLLRRRVVAIYKMQRRSGGLDYIVNADTAVDLMKRATYLASITRHDNTRLRILNELIQEFSSEQRELVALRGEREQRLTENQQLETVLRSKKLEQAQLRDELRREEVVRKSSLGKLNRSAQRLEQVLAKVMGSDLDDEPVQPPESPEPPDAVPTPSPKPIPVPKPFVGTGLASLRGQLGLPVQGVLVRRFGKQRHDEFDDILFVKGLEFRGDVGGKVRVVAAGKVVLSQVLPGYGNVLIVDHGRRYYTLYGRLAGALRQVGDVVQAGDVIAVLGEVDKKQRNFYFELRIKGNPVNPTKYFQTPPRLVES